MTGKFQARAHHSYAKAKPDELDLSPGDVIQVTSDEQASWWVGVNETTKESGWFPSNFVTRIEAAAKPKSGGGGKPRRQMRVVKRYEATDKADLSLEVGDIVDVKKEVDGWCMGRLDGRVGLFPASHAVDHAPDDEAPAAARPLPQPPAVPAPAPAPALPMRGPPLPARASTETALGDMQQPDDDADGARKEKKAGHRISRLFGAKKPRARDDASDAEALSPAARPAMEPMSAASDDAMSPPPPPPPPPIASPPPPARAVPPVPLPAPAAPQPTLPPRRPSVASSAASPPPPAAPPALPPIAAVAAAAEDGGDGDGDGNRPAEDAQSPAPDASAAAAPEPRAPAAPRLAKIVKDYEAQSPEELNLMLDDVVTIISRGTDDDPRWKGEYHGKKGYFPASVVEPIEESAALDDEDADADSRPRGGFRLAAYGVQQGGLGSIFAGAGGMPALRKAPARNKPADAEPADAEPAAPAPAPAAAPVMPKLRSVPRTPAREPPKDDEPPNFLAQLAKVPRRPAPPPSEEDPAASPAAQPRKAPGPAAAADSAEQRPDAVVPDLDAADAPPAARPALAASLSDDESNSGQPAEEPADESAKAAGSADGDDGERDGGENGDDDDDDDDGGGGEAAEDQRAAYDPVKAPSLTPVKRLVRRGPRQMPTAEALKKSSGESQSRSLHSALQKDKDLDPPTPVDEKPLSPPSDKPRGFARYGSFAGPQLPAAGGFTPSGRVGSAMASRLAALQAKAAGGGGGGGGGDDANEASEDAPSPPPVARKPSFAPRAQPEPAQAPAAPAAVPAAAAVPAEWQKKIDDELARLRADADRARRSEELAEQLSARLASSEAEARAHKQAAAALERQVESLAAQVASLASGLSGVQRAVGDLSSSSKSVSPAEVAAIVQAELKAALDPIHQHTSATKDDLARLDKKIADLRTYVDELVVEEEEA
ncbi:hypothetical protein H4R18_001937 [Coemansia javaensis]|uniref:SH3 domain-containing protein n=1 Tax=Coemansia javaensis TaxID=2761396 RepID=A0A9W8HJZ2_9FUNG|nr:hypothetical protein H4R18_001937 [Coemansia javaensis]